MDQLGLPRADLQKGKAFKEKMWTPARGRDGSIRRPHGRVELVGRYLAGPSSAGVRRGPDRSGRTRRSRGGFVRSRNSECKRRQPGPAPGGRGRERRGLVRMFVFHCELVGVVHKAVWVRCEERMGLCRKNGPLVAPLSPHRSREEGQGGACAATKECCGEVADGPRRPTDFLLTTLAHRLARNLGSKRPEPPAPASF